MYAIRKDGQGWRAVNGEDDVGAGETYSATLPQLTTADLTKQLVGALTNAIQQHLDATAQSLGYDDIRSAATYADEPAVAKFQDEGRALRAWRSMLWAAAYVKMQRVRSGLEPVPTSEELMASLPAFTAP